MTEIMGASFASDSPRSNYFLLMVKCDRVSELAGAAMGDFIVRESLW